MYDNILLNELETWGADIAGALERFMDNEELYLKFIKKFQSGTDIEDLTKAVSESDWENSLHIAHTLKGVTGNFGFTKLYQGFSEIVDDIRAETYTGISEKYEQVKKDYQDVCEIIAKHI